VARPSQVAGDEKQIEMDGDKMAVRSDDTESKLLLDLVSDFVQK